MTRPNKHRARFGVRIGGDHALRRYRSQLLAWRDRKGRRVSLLRGALLFGRDDYRQVALTTVHDVRVSTVWLSGGQSFGDSEQGLVFETMVFGGLLDQAQRRYATEREARRGHNRMVGYVSAARQVTP